MPNAAQDTIKLLSGKGTLLAHVQLDLYQETQVFFCKAAFQANVSKHLLVPGAMPPQVQNFTLPFVLLHKVSVDPFLQLLKIPLEGGHHTTSTRGYLHGISICCGKDVGRSNHRKVVSSTWKSASQHTL